MVVQHREVARPRVSSGLACALRVLAAAGVALAATLAAATLDPFGAQLRLASACAGVVACWLIVASFVRLNVDRRLRRALVVMLAAAAAYVALEALQAIVPAGNGLDAAYFAGAAASGPPLRAGVERVPSTVRLKQWRGPAPASFNAVWTGFLTTRRGLYRFGLTSDDGSRLFIDDRLVVDNWGSHGPVTRTGDARLTSGSHRVRLEYQQDGGGLELAWTWSADGGRTEAVPDWALSQLAVSYRAALTAAVLDLLTLVAIGALIVSAVLYVPATVLQLGREFVAFARPRLERQYVNRTSLFVSAGVFLLLLLPPWGNGGLLWPVAATVRDSGAAARRRLQPWPAPQADLDTPQSGEYALGDIPVEVLTLLRGHNIDRYRLSPSFSNDDWLFQRVVTSAWPRRLDPKATASFILDGEPLSGSCRVEDRLGEVTLADCQ